MAPRSCSPRLHDLAVQFKILATPLGFNIQTTCLGTLGQLHLSFFWFDKSVPVSAGIPELSAAVGKLGAAVKADRPTTLI